MQGAGDVVRGLGRATDPPPSAGSGKEARLRFSSCSSDFREAHVTQPRIPGGAPTSSAQQFNRISTQLRDLNAAYKAAVASSG
jgi:hypothetical protein